MTTVEPGPPTRRDSGWTSAARGLRNGVANASRIAGAGLVRMGGAIAPVTGVVTPFGRIALASAAGALVLAGVLGWIEFLFLGATLLAAVVLACLTLFGRAQYRVEIGLEPARVVAGERAMGRMLVTNAAPRRSAPTRMELPVGAGVAEFRVPSLDPGGGREELFAVPTARRAVIPAGPALSVRGDQLGLLRRTVRWTEVIELFVHPVTARLQPSAAGLVRDLEGEVTPVVTDNDISFHALRAYEPGDPLRNVHWRTTARTGTLMVRQFEETRRSELVIVQSTDAAHYASDDEFELAVSITASLAVQVLQDGTTMHAVTDALRLRTATPTALLDDCARIEPVAGVHPSLRELARAQTSRLAAPSVVLLVAGSMLPVAEFRGVQRLFGADTRVLAFRAEHGARPGIRSAGLPVATVGRLDELPPIVRSVRG
ncbi:hypothetical protein ARHIZOSPH14_28620 [Agromyces rhizosphaerae]|uniref:DUF58 domain-containing protein n=1 Tax=Agromyces rhizosphaerae TaxID=88374 RepID=A0A9W6FQK1_9MICO|nr:DUF58 domain-containing protein [Agromyces rhizosphaerae]GLI28620.1 hypothetical protein ARHIZOSPH14_28620 [Agromyces rhizosphaerae]